MEKRERAIDYFALKCGQEEFWQWAPDAASVVWADGSIVSSTEELVAVLQHLESTGLPPFGALVHLLAACRGRTLEITWNKPTEDQRRNFRVPCVIESGDKRVGQWQRVKSFGTPEGISTATARLAQLPGELEGILDDPRALPELAGLVFSELESPELSEGMITLLANGEFAGEDLNSPYWGAKYPSVLVDLALLSKSFDTLPSGDLRRRLIDALADQGTFLNGRQRMSEQDVRVIRQFQLPTQRHWQEATACESGFCAASRSATESEAPLLVVRSNWEGATQIVRWQTADPHQPVILVPVEDERVLVHQPGCPMLPDQFVSQPEGAFAKPLVIGGGGWLPAGTLQLAWNEGRVWVLARQPDYIELAGHAADGQFCERNYGPELQRIAQQPGEFVPMVAMSHSVALGVGRDLVIFDLLHVSATYHFGAAIKKLAVGKSGRMTGIVVCLDRGVKLHWHGSDGVLPVDDEVVNPVAAFTADGRLVVAGDHRGRVYDLDRHGVSAVWSFDWTDPAPVGVMATATPAEFATLTRKGSVQVWCIA